MRKRRGGIRRFVTGVTALLVALGVAGYAIVASLDVQRVADFARGQIKSATGRDLVIDGPVELQVSLTPAVNLEAVRFANAPWGSRADMATLRRLEIEVELLPLLFGEVVVKRLVVVEPDILLETGAEGQGNWVFAEAAATAEPPSAAAADGDITLPDVQDVLVEGGRLTLLDAGRQQVLRLEIVKAVGAVPAGGGSRSLELEAAYNGNPFRLEAVYGGLPALLSGAPAPLEASVEAGGVTLSAKGRAGNLAGAAEAELALTAAGDSLAGLSPFLGTELPALGPFKLSADTRLESQAIEVKSMSLQVGGSDLAGNATLALAAARPAVKAALVSKRLDLADFSGRAAPGGGAAGAPPAGAGGAADRVFPDEPLPLAALTAVDANVKLGADLLRLTPQLELEELQLTLALAGGRLTVAPLTAGLAGGRLDGRLTLAAAEAEPALTLTLDGSDIDFGDLLKRAEVSDEVAGKLALDIDLEGRGASPHALAAGLGGHVQAVSQDGTIDNSILSALSAGLGDITGPLFGQSRSTRLECLVARFDIDRGQAKSRALVLDSGTFAVAGRGGIDLGAEQVNLAFDTQTSQPSLASLAVPFKVVGPLADPEVVPDAVGAVTGAVGTVGDVARSGGNIVGGAVDAVGGLVGTGPLIGPVGGSRDLCAEALAAIGRGGQAPASSAPSSSAPPSSGGIVDDAGKALQDAGDAIEKGIKNLFGN